MKTFEILYYKDGIAQKQNIICKNRQEAIEYCNQHQLNIIRISLKENIPAASFTLSRHLSIPRKDLMIFFYQFSILLESGIPIYELLKNTSAHGHNPKITAFLNSMLHGIEEGKTLSESLSPYQKSIGELGMALIDMGEKSGNLSTAFALLSNHIKSQAKHQAKLKNMLIYPTFLFIALLFAFIIIIGYLLPQFQTLFENFNQTLPPLTQFLFSLRILTTPQALLIITIFIISLFALIMFAYKTPKIRLIIDACLLKIPLIGKILYAQQLFFYFSTLKLLLEMGFSLDQTLKLCTQTLSNAHLKQNLNFVLEYLQKGHSFKQSLQKTSILPALDLELIAIAEMSGEMGKMLGIIIALHEESFTQKQTQILSFIEPMITLVVAIFVLILALGIFMPLWELNRVF